MLKRNKAFIVQEEESPYISTTFKIWVCALIFFLVIFHLYTIVVFPLGSVVSNEILIGVVLVLVIYIWSQEVKDRNRLQLLNISLVDAQHRLEHAEVDTIAVLILTLEAKDPYVRGHSRRVAKRSLVIAKEMGLSKERQAIINRAGILHDIGKLAIEDEVLKKPDKLTDEEWFIMKQHPARSVEILEPLEFLSKEKEIILHHHERWDGQGYPDRIKAEAIPLESRIMAVADTFDAMNSERAYRKALSPDAIIAELKRVSGAQLDSSIVNLFLNLLKKEPDLFKNI